MKNSLQKYNNSFHRLNKHSPISKNNNSVKSLLKNNGVSAAEAYEKVNKLLNNKIIENKKYALKKNNKDIKSDKFNSKKI
jgi:hypothetical protein